MILPRFLLCSFYNWNPASIFIIPTGPSLGDDQLKLVREELILLRVKRDESEKRFTSGQKNHVTAQPLVNNQRSPKLREAEPCYNETQSDSQARICSHY